MSREPGDAMQRCWSLLFLVVPLCCGAMYALAAWGVQPLQGFWLPPNYNLGGDSIDYLFSLTHLVAALLLVLTIGALFWFCWAGTARERAASLQAGNTRLEVVWTFIPACLLIGLALAQFRSWDENKRLHPQVEVNGQWEPKPPLVKVVAKRFGWEFYYAGRDGALDTPDDIFVENLLVAPRGEDVVLRLESRDVIHGFFVPHLRLKQDVVPGLPQALWFHAKESVELDIVCAELCGWGHYSMQARLRLVSRADFDRWIAEQTARRRASGGSAP